MTTLQFVADMVTSTPTVLLDLNVSPFNLAPGFDFSPSEWDRGWVGNPMTHGARPTRASAQNRTLTIPLQIVSTTASGFSTAIENLGRQLALDGFIKYQSNQSAQPVFFRYFGNPQYSAQVRGILSCAVQYQVVVLQITAEPWAYGPRVEASGSPFTVSNDPAAAGGCFFDISSVQGDVETPLLLEVTSTGVTGIPSGMVNKWTHIGMRRRGTPGNYSNVIQAEDATNGTDAADTVDATMSNGNKVRISYATATGLTLRLSDTFPGNGTATVEARGEYVVYARVARTSTGGTIHMQLGYGASSAAAIFNAQVTPAFVTTPQWVNLGKVPIPVWSDPREHGYSGSKLKAVLPFWGIWTDRVSGTANLDIDVIVFVPADDLTLIVRFPSTDTTYAIDGTTDSGGAVYGLTTALDEVVTTASPAQILGSGFPEVIPGQTNRIHFLRQVDPTSTGPAQVDTLTSTTTIRAYYWPRWRELTRT